MHTPNSGLRKAPELVWTIWIPGESFGFAKNRTHDSSAFQPKLVTIPTELSWLYSNKSPGAGGGAAEAL
jgi:hypothetical protein